MHRLQNMKSSGGLGLERPSPDSKIRRRKKEDVNVNCSGCYLCDQTNNSKHCRGKNKTLNNFYKNRVQNI